MALKRRDVELCWFTPQKDDADCLLRVDEPGSIVVGFIVNSLNEKSIFRRVPILSGWFGDGRHWFAITRLQRGAKKPATKWKVIDSMYDEVEFFDTDEAILNQLCSIVEDGGNIFRATVCVDK